MSQGSIFSPRTRFKILHRDDHTCQYCGAKAPDVELQIDHIIPISLGGRGTVDNGVTACADCNQGKSNLDLLSLDVDTWDRDAARFSALMSQKFAKAAETRASLVDYRHELGAAIRAKGIPDDAREFWDMLYFPAADWHMADVPIDAIAGVMVETFQWYAVTALTKKRRSSWVEFARKFIENVGDMVAATAREVLAEMSDAA